MSVHPPSDVRITVVNSMTQGGVPVVRAKRRNKEKKGKKRGNGLRVMRLRRARRKVERGLHLNNRTKEYHGAEIRRRANAAALRAIRR
jgi:hypothetical protein